ncbi:MAG: carbamoyl-phosphate synthase large subunit, partial [Gammaproteobacteria bacterium]|nr:carbamoyl-phosphate synthase large subunit [Gammaproteobacteria bacterium]
FPPADHVEVIASIATGKSVSPFYDSLVAQIVVFGNDRADGIAKMVQYLETIQIEGICTNIPLLLRILQDVQFNKGEYDTTYLPKFLARTDGDQLLAEMARSGSSGQKETSIEIEDSVELKVLSPQTGIFYARPSPSDPPYVTAGDTISTEQTICQLEAMKMFSSVSLDSFNGTSELYSSEKQYEIVRVNQTNGAQVNTGDLLFVVKPA